MPVTNRPSAIACSVWRGTCPLILALSVFFRMFCSAALATSATVSVSRVIDGDTIVVHVGDRDAGEVGAGRQEAGPLLVRVRLADIDAPELAQPHGSEARIHLATLIAGKTVRLDYNKRDRYGRILGAIHLGSININLTMVQAGHAWRYRYARKTGVVAQAEEEARSNRLGLWSASSPLAPWLHRRMTLATTSRPAVASVARAY